jgi:hypothetical protein
VLPVIAIAPDFVVAEARFEVARRDRRRREGQRRRNQRSGQRSGTTCVG